MRIRQQSLDERYGGANHDSPSRHVSDSQPITYAIPATSVAVSQSPQPLPPRQRQSAKFQRDILIRQQSLDKC
jgi:hypothetical protein